MFWTDNQQEYDIIENVPLHILEEWAKHEGINADINKLNNRWALYAYYKARTIDTSVYANSQELYKTRGIGLDIVKSSSFADTIAWIMTNEKTSFTIDNYLKEDKIHKQVELLYSKRNISFSEEEQKIQLFNDILLFYNVDSYKFEKRIFKHDCYIPEEYYHDIELLKSQSDKATGEQIATLTSEYDFDMDDLSDVIGRKNCRVTFYLTYSEEEKFIKVKGKKDANKVINLIINYRGYDNV